jgi:hypothetical protein
MVYSRDIAAAYIRRAGPGAFFVRNLRPKQGGSAHLLARLSGT